MKILVLHQLPYRKAGYDRAVDHLRHDVTYAGHADRLADLPAGLPARRLPVPADEDFAEAVVARTSPADGFEAVLSLSEFGVLAVCRVRAHLGLPGPTPEQAELAHDKVRMKQALAGSGVRHPRFAAEPPREGPLPWSGPTVLKPRRGTCSEGVSVFPSARRALAAHRALAEPRAYELEEYVDGDILHTDGLVEDGTLVHSVTSRYVGKPADYAGGAPLGSHQLPPDARYEDLARRVVTALGIDRGTLHLEFFETPRGELVFLEAANRMGGAGVVDAHLRHTGVHLPSHEIALRLGLPRPAPLPPSGRYHGWLVVPGHHRPAGRPHRVSLPAHLRDHPCADRIHTLPPGTPAARHITYQEWLVPLALEASHPDPDTLRAYLAACAEATATATEEAA
ncbi:acetyl-CoA carboxylase biotin carboxylase subunit family protein [Streptomyces termitum]|uniref:acetyl-CoA carboxylase biotin carboxylase subunit family protein n=1 Tax=Streptomyces termitum TaxID=67368 RepID=UPI0037A98760